MGVLPALPSSDDLLSEILVGVSRQFLVSKPDAQGVLDDAVERLLGGDVGQRVRREGEAVDHSIPDGGRFLGQHLAETLVGTGLGVGLVDVLEEDGNQPGSEEGRADLHHGEAVKPGAGRVAARPVGEEHQSYTNHRDDGREECKFGLVEARERT